MTKKNFEGYWEENGSAPVQDEREEMDEPAVAEEPAEEKKAAPEAKTASHEETEEDMFDDEFEDEYSYDEDDEDLDDEDGFAGVDEKTSVLLDKLEELWHAGILTEDEYLKKVNLLLNGSGSIDYENLALKLVAGAALVSTATLAIALAVTRHKAKVQKTRSDMLIERLSGVRGDLSDMFGKLRNRGMDFFNR